MRTATLFGLALLAGASCEKSNTVNTTNNNYTTINNITQSVGLAGARVTSPGGAIADIPAGALTAEASISIGEVAPTAASVPALPSGMALRSPIFAYEPHGLTFGGDVTLTLPHTAGTDAVQILRSDPNGAWQPLTGLGPLNGRAQATTRAFSFYAVFTGGSGPSDGGVTGGIDACGGDRPPCAAGLYCACPDGTPFAGSCEGGAPACRACGACPTSGCCPR